MANSEMVVRRHPDAHYQAVARIYSEGPLNRGSKHVADRFDVPQTTANRWVKRARELGFLEPWASRPCKTCGRPLEEADHPEFGQAQLFFVLSYYGGLNV